MKVLDVLTLLARRDGLTCTEIGESLWVNRVTNANRQSWARPAGKLVKSALDAGFVREYSQPIKDRDTGKTAYHRRLIYLTDFGRQKISSNSAVVREGGAI